MINNSRIRICQHDIIVKTFLRCRVSLVIFSYSSKFYFNIITGSGFMSILVYKALTRNPEISLDWVGPLSKLWRVWDAKFGRNVSNWKFSWRCKMPDLQLSSFWVIKGKPAGAVGRVNLPTHIRFNVDNVIKTPWKNKLDKKWKLVKTHNWMKHARIHNRKFCSYTGKWKPKKTRILAYFTLWYSKKIKWKSCSTARFSLLKTV